MIPVFRCDRPSQPVGQCIYCGTADGQLKDEHVLPHGLGGRLVLHQATCDRCADITSAFERKVLRESLGVVRTKLGLPSYHKRRRATTTNLEVLQQGVWVPYTLRIADAPGFFALPKFVPPGYFTGATAPDRQMVVSEVQTIVLDQLSMYTTLRALGATGIRCHFRGDPYEWARLIAKIGYGFAVYQYGVHGWAEVFAVPAILGREGTIGRWVGCLPKPHIPASTPATIAGGHHVALATNPADGVVAATVRLFAQVAPGVTEYCVVVGRRDQK